MPVEEHLSYPPEPPAVDLRTVTWPALAVLVLLALAIGGLYAVYEFELPVKTPPQPQTFAQPRVATHESEIAALRELAGEQKQRLQSWRWANDQHTLVEVPIDRAMQLLAQKGGDAWAPLLPQQPALASPTAGAQRAITPDAVSQGTTSTRSSAAPPSNATTQDKR